MSYKSSSIWHMGFWTSNSFGHLFLYLFLWAFVWRERKRKILPNLKAIQLWGLKVGRENQGRGDMRLWSRGGTMIKGGIQAWTYLGSWVSKERSIRARGWQVNGLRNEPRDTKSYLARLQRSCMAMKELCQFQSKSCLMKGMANNQCLLWAM